MTRLGPKFSSRTRGGGGGMAMTVLAAAFLFWAIVASPRRSAAPSSPSIGGTYKVRVVGYGSGGGTCDVGSRVSIDCQVTDDGGNRQRLRAPNLKLDGSRFRGNGTLDGAAVRISGRVDPADASAPSPHVSATFVAEDGRAGRIVGPRD